MWFQSMCSGATIDAMVVKADRGAKEDAASFPILARGLVKRYGDLTAVAGLDVQARRGTCLGLLGPNGAGKTTTIEMLEGLTTPDGGEIHLLGMTWRRDAYRIRERIGVQLQETHLQEKLTVLESLRLFRSFYSRGRELRSVIDLVRLGEKASSRVDELSGGQKQRLALGCALVGEPEILFLDEPTTGLDPQARRHLWEIVEDFKQQGGTVLLTTHYMEEAERLADDLLIVDRGQKIAEGSPAAIVRTLGAESIIEWTLPPGDDARTIDTDPLASLPGVDTARALGGTVTLTVTDTQEALTSLLDWMKREGVVAEDVRTHRPTLEDVFVAMTGKQLRDG